MPFEKTERSDEWILELKEKMAKEFFAEQLRDKMNNVDKIPDTKIFVPEKSWITSPNNKDNDWGECGF